MAKRARTSRAELANARAAQANAEAAKIQAETARKRADQAGDPLERVYQLATNIVAPLVGMWGGHQLAQVIEKRAVVNQQVVNAGLAQLARRSNEIMARASNGTMNALMASTELQAINRTMRGLNMQKYGGPLALLTAGILVTEGLVQRLYLADKIPNESAAEATRAVGTGVAFAGAALAADRLMQSQSASILPNAADLAAIEAGAANRDAIIAMRPGSSTAAAYANRTVESVGRATRIEAAATRAAVTESAGVGIVASMGEVAERVGMTAGEIGTEASRMYRAIAAHPEVAAFAREAGRYSRNLEKYAGPAARVALPFLAGYLAYNGYSAAREHGSDVVSAIGSGAGYATDQLLGGAITTFEKDRAAGASLPWATTRAAVVGADGLLTGGLGGEAVSYLRAHGLELAASAGSAVATGAAAGGQAAADAAAYVYRNAPDAAATAASAVVTAASATADATVATAGAIGSATTATAAAAVGGWAWLTGQQPAQPTAYLKGVAPQPVSVPKATTAVVTSVPAAPKGSGPVDVKAFTRKDGSKVKSFRRARARK